MAERQSLTFLFTSVTSPNLASLHRRSNSPDLQRFFNDTVNFYEEFLIARDGGYKLVMVPPGSQEALEIDDQEDFKKHKPRGYVTVSTDLSRVHDVAVRGGFVAAQTMLTKAFIVRERVIEAIEYGWRVGFYKAGENNIIYQPYGRFSPMDKPGPTTLQ